MPGSVLDQFDREAVSTLIADAADAEIVPRFRRLADHEIRDKGRGDPVTEADLAVEAILSRSLMRLLPGSTVVGEETVHTDDSILDRLSGAAPVWVIDPLDGTKNFAEGREAFCVMVALVVQGQTMAAWIYTPLNKVMTTAVAGGGVRADGRALQAAEQRPLQDMRGAVHLRYLPGDARRRVELGLDAFGSNTELYCAGETYLQLARGDLDHALFWRAKPWDHAPGALILAEAGGHTAFLDQSAYMPAPPGHKGLIAVAAPAMWRPVREALGLVVSDMRP